MSTTWKYWLVLTLFLLLLTVVPYFVFILTGSIIIAFVVFVFWFLFMTVQSYRGKGVFNRIMLSRRTAGNPMAITYETYGGSGETRAKAAARALDDFDTD